MICITRCESLRIEQNFIEFPCQPKISSMFTISYRAKTLAKRYCSIIQFLPDLPDLIYETKRWQNVSKRYTIHVNKIHLWLVRGLIWKTKQIFNRKTVHSCNWYKPSVPFLGHRQTVQSQIRHRKTWRLIASDQGLHCLLTGISIRNRTRKSITCNYMLYKGIVDSKINNHFSIVHLGLMN